MADEEQAPVEEAAPEQPAEQEVQPAKPARTLPEANEELVHYLGEEPITREGFTWQPDGLVVVPEDIVRRIVGRDHLRVVVNPQAFIEMRLMRGRTAPAPTT